MSECCGGETHREAKVVEPVDNPTVDGNLVPRKPQALKQIAGLLRAKSVEFVINYVGCFSFGLTGLIQSKFFKHLHCLVPTAIAFQIVQICDEFPGNSAT